MSVSKGGVVVLAFVSSRRAGTSPEEPHEPQQALLHLIPARLITNRNAGAIPQLPVSEVLQLTRESAGVLTYFLQAREIL